MDAEAAYSRCLADEGFDYQQRTISVDVTTSDGGLLTISESRREHGYGIAGGDGNAGVEVTIRGGDVPTEQAAAYDAVLRSGEEHRCADLQFDGDIQQILAELRFDFDAEVVSRVTTDRAYLEAQDSWSGCMLEAGHNYRSSADVFADLDRRFNALDSESATYEEDLDALRALELSIAGEDVDCYFEHVEPVVAELLADLPGSGDSS